ncbi:MAG: polysaccharide biosynthesis/export family protein [Candidatus Aminicenantes bacterium]|nr:polysaccharide biosynthesis/export family protein [Candidatus Aminicenantes bacterium]
MNKSLICLVLSILLLTRIGTSSNFSAQETQKYLVGPGDVLSIEVWRHPDTSKDVIVNYKGEITLAPIKNMFVAGLSTPQIEEKLAESLSFFLIDPIVYVTVKEFNSQKVSVFGAVIPNRGQGEFPLKKPTPLLEFLSQIGGPTENADTSKITLIKKSGGTFIYDLEELLSTPLESSQIILENGDSIYIPTVKHQKIYILGEVNKPQSLDIEGEMFILDAITKAEGFTPNAVTRSIVVIRRDSGSQKGIRVDFKKLRKTADLSQNILLQPGDIVFVPKSFVGDVERFLRVLSTPLLFWFTTSAIK